MKKNKDTDYLHISTRIRCVEGQLMNSTQLYRLAESKDAQEAEKLLEEKGWPAFDWRDMLKLEQVISAYEAAGLTKIRQLHKGEWFALAFRK